MYKGIQKTTLFSNFNELHQYLRIGNIPKQPYNVYSNKLTINQCIDDNINIFRICKTKLFFDYAGNDYKTSNDFIGTLHYKWNPDNIKIKYINVDVDKNNNYNDFYFDAKEAIELKKSLIAYVKNLAKEENKHKIIADVHHNLKTYKTLYMNEGFDVTTRKSSHNPQWIEIEHRV